MTAENADWLRNNVNIFLDQNISIEVRNPLIKKGYKNIFDVYSLGLVGANDGKIHKLLKSRKMILVTSDRHFHKQSEKYGIPSIFIPYAPYRPYGAKHIATIIQSNLITNFKLVRKYYE